MNSNLSKIVNIRLGALSYSLSQPLSSLAERCAEFVDQPDRLNRLLSTNLVRLERGSLLYVINPFGIQLSDNVGKQENDKQFLGQDLSSRLWFKAACKSNKKLHLSDVYISQPDGEIGITAVSKIRNSSGTLLGYLCVDFKLENLPYIEGHQPEVEQWKRLSGDPSIRDLMFHHERVVSEMEERFEQLKPILKELVLRRGVFHFKLHFSASRATLWHVGDPMRYQVVMLQELMKPSLCLAYDRHELANEFATSESTFDKLLDHFYSLRTSDEYLYLRSASFNVANQLVGFNLSWDSQHYLPIGEFLKTEPQQWIGSNHIWFGDDVASGSA